MKLSQDIEKVTIPGKKDAYRLYGGDGKDTLLRSATLKAQLVLVNLHLGPLYCLARYEELYKKCKSISKIKNELMRRSAGRDDNIVRL